MNITVTGVYIFHLWNFNSDQNPSTEVLCGCIGMTTTVPHIYISIFINVKGCTYLRLKSEVAAYLPLFVVCCWVVVDCDLGLRCHVVTRPPVSRGRWWTAGHGVDWPEVCGGIEAATTGSDGVLLDAPDEWWCARSTKHRGRAVMTPVLPSFLLGVLLLLLSDKLLLLDVGVGLILRPETWSFYMDFLLFTCPSIGQLTDLVGVAFSTNMLIKVPWWKSALGLELWAETGVCSERRTGKRERALLLCVMEEGELPCGCPHTQYHSYAYFCSEKTCNST